MSLKEKIENLFHDKEILLDVLSSPNHDCPYSIKGCHKHTNPIKEVVHECGCILCDCPYSQIKNLKA